MTIDDVKEFIKDATGEELDDIRVASIMEKERRLKLETWPNDLAEMAKNAVAAGCDPEELKVQISDAIDNPDPVQELLVTDEEAPQE